MLGRLDHQATAARRTMVVSAPPTAMKRRAGLMARSAAPIWVEAKRSSKDTEGRDQVEGDTSGERIRLLRLDQRLVSLDEAITHLDEDLEGELRFLGCGHHLVELDRLATDIGLDRVTRLVLELGHITDRITNHIGEGRSAFVGQRCERSRLRNSRRSGANRIDLHGSRTWV